MGPPEAALVIMQPDDGKPASSAAHYSTAQCLKAFGRAQQALSAAPQDLSGLIRKEALADEVGRFRVWSANIGALQKGHSSLDYRLRESPLVHENILKLLRELFDCVQEGQSSLFLDFQESSCHVSQDGRTSAFVVSLLSILSMMAHFLFPYSPNLTRFSTTCPIRL
jgi:hypothetical protein